MTSSRVPDSRFFFIHIMKTAGTTLYSQLRAQFEEAVFYPRQGLDWTDPGDIGAYSSIARLNALSAERKAFTKVFCGHFPYFAASIIDPSLVTLSVLREPTERTVSLLKHFKRMEPECFDWSLEEIYSEPVRFRALVHNHQTKVFAMRRSDWCNSVRNPLEIDEERYEQAVANLERVDVLGLTEEYPRFIAVLRERFGWWPGGAPDDRENVASEPWEVSESLRERIAADNTWDLALYARARSIVLGSP